MENQFSSKRKKLASHSDIHEDVWIPHLVSSHAQIKYKLLQPNLVPGLGITFYSFPNVLDNIINIGWECLVVFHDRNIYPALIADFYSHLIFNKNELGFLTSITTYIQGVEYTIDEQMLINALHLRPSIADLPRVNGYISPLVYTDSECTNFKQNLAFATDQIIPAISFDYPVNVSPDYLTAPFQFLGKILMYNFMPARVNQTISPFDLEMMKCILNENMPFNLAYFLLTSFELCFHNNCMGYGLLLTQIFKYLKIDVVPLSFQLIPNSNIVSRLKLPPKPLITFQDFDHEPIESHLNIFSQIETLSHFNQLLFHNQSKLMVQVEEIQQSIEHLKVMVQSLIEKSEHIVLPSSFTASTSSAPPNPLDMSLPEDLLPTLGLHFSPISLGEF